MVHGEEHPLQAQHLPGILNTQLLMRSPETG